MTFCTKCGTVDASYGGFMKIISDNYVVKTNLNLDRDKRFLSFSDIHYGILQQLFYKGYMKKYFECLVKDNQGVDAILIPGDLIFFLFKFQDAKFLSALKRDLMDLSCKLGAPIFISYGNHDLPFKQSELSDEEKRQWDLGQYVDNREKGLFVLNNEQIRLSEDTVVTGFSPTRDAYNPSSMPTDALTIASSAFNECGFRFNESDLNILLSHENKFFTHSDVIQSYGDLYTKLTCILGGHLHDGYVPLWVQNIFKNSLQDYGIWETYPPLIDKCRGAFKVSREGISDMILPSYNESACVSLEDNETISIVNRGVAKYSWFLPSSAAYTTLRFTNDEQDRGHGRVLK